MKFSTLIAIVSAAGLAQAAVLKRQHDHGAASMADPAPAGPMSAMDHGEAMPDMMPDMGHGEPMDDMMPGMSHSGMKEKRQHDHGSASMPPPAPANPMAGMDHGGDMSEMMSDMGNGGSMPGMHEGMDMRS